MFASLVLLQVFIMRPSLQLQILQILMASKPAANVAACLPSLHYSAPTTLQTVPQNVLVVEPATFTNTGTCLLWFALLGHDTDALGRFGVNTTSETDTL